MSATLQRDQPTWTNANLFLFFLSLPLYHEALSGAYAWRKGEGKGWRAKGKRSQWREGMHNDLAGSAWSKQEMKATLDLPCQTPSTKADRRACPQINPDPLFFFFLLQDHNQTPRQPLGSFWSSCDWMTKKKKERKVERIINDSNLVLAFSHHISFIHTSYSDEQCITQKYKGKILVLHYTFSKIYTE